MADMTYDEADHHIKRMEEWMSNGINAATTAQRLYIEFDERKGWAAFTDDAGKQLYVDCESCVYAKLRPLLGSRQRAHQLSVFAGIIKDIDPVLILPSGNAKESLKKDKAKHPIVSEGLLRPLGAVKGVKKRQACMKHAIDLAAARGEKVTAKHVSQAVKIKVKRPVKTEDEQIKSKVDEILGRISRMCVVLNKMPGMDTGVSTMLTKAYNRLSEWEIPEGAEL